MKKLSKRFEILQKAVSPLLDEEVIPSVLCERKENLLDYKSIRYLDAWARVLNIQDPCTAVTQINGTIYVSYNKVEKVANNNALNLIQCSLSDKEAFLCAALLFNRPLINELSHYNTGLAEQLSKKIDQVRGKSLTKKSIIVEDINSIFNLQEQIFVNYDPKNKKLIEVLLGINQDVSKILHYKNINVNFQLVENSKGMHAELAVLTWIKESEYWDQWFSQLNYIGISKLSCYLCDEVLKELYIGHRGTFGKLYLNKWVFPDNSLYNESQKEKLINKIDKHRKKYWKDAGEHITNNTHIIDKLPPEEAELSDSENDQNIILVKYINGAETLGEIKAVQVINQMKFLQQLAYNLIQQAREWGEQQGYLIKNTDITGKELFVFKECLELNKIKDARFDFKDIEQIKKLYNEEYSSSIIYESNIEILPNNKFSYDSNVLKVIGGGSESWESTDDLYC